MESFVCMISILKRSKLNQYDRNNEKVQLKIPKGDILKTKNKNRLNSS